MTIFGYRQENIDRPDRLRFSIVIFLPTHLDRIVAPLRERFDPDYSVMSSHVTLVAPFETELSIGEIARIIRREVESIEDLTIHLGSIGDYYPSFPVIYWSCKNEGELTILSRNLYARLDLALPCKEYAPHVAVGREISGHRLLLVKEQIAPYLPEESFTASAIDLVSPVAGQNWVSVRTFPLRTRL